MMGVMSFDIMSSCHVMLCHVMLFDGTPCPDNEMS